MSKTVGYVRSVLYIDKTVAIRLLAVAALWCDLTTKNLSKLLICSQSFTGVEFTMLVTSFKHYVSGPLTSSHPTAAFYSKKTLIDSGNIALYTP